MAPDGMLQVGMSVVADGSCQSKPVRGVPNFYRASVAHSVADALSDLARPVQAVFLDANCGGDPGSMMGWGACESFPSGSMKHTCPIGTANATESEVCTYTDERCQVPNMQIPCRPSPTLGTLGICTKEPGGAHSRPVAVALITFCTDTLPSHPPAGGGGPAHVKSKLSAGEDAGIAIGVLAVVGIAVGLGLYATKWRKASTYSSVP